MDIVKDLESLESLDLSENGLEEIDCRLMTSLPRLLSLNLRGNRFADLRYASVACCSPTLMRLDMSGNRLNVVDVPSTGAVEPLGSRVPETELQRVRKPSERRRRAVAARSRPARSARRRRQPVRRSSDQWPASDQERLVSRFVGLKDLPAQSTLKTVSHRIRRPRGTVRHRIECERTA